MSNEYGDHPLCPEAKERNLKKEEENPSSSHLINLTQNNKRELEYLRMNKINPIITKF